MDADLYVPILPDRSGINPAADLPYGLTGQQVFTALSDFIAFLSGINQQLAAQEILRFESLLMPANFSSIVGEYVIGSIAKHCPTLTKNRYHNGHPDLIPVGAYPGDRVQYGEMGIEVKASRYLRGWQGHNPETVWLMVIVFEVERTPSRGQKLPVPFQFKVVAGAPLFKTDWRFSGRGVASRRTITASVTRSGYEKIMANWIYHGSSIREERLLKTNTTLWNTYVGQLRNRL